MMSLSAIRDLAKEAAKVARRNGYRPVFPTLEQINSWQVKGRFPIKSLGTYVPAGLIALGDPAFVDKFGEDDGYALGITGLCGWMRERVQEWGEGKVGFAISEEGQFQLYVSAYVQRTDWKKKQVKGE